VFESVGRESVRTASALAPERVVRWIRESASHTRTNSIIRIGSTSTGWRRCIGYHTLHISLLESWDALRCRSLSAKEPLILGLFCGK